MASALSSPEVWAPAIPTQRALGGGPTDATEHLPCAPHTAGTFQSFCQPHSSRIRGGFVSLVPKMREQTPRGPHHQQVTGWDQARCVCL